MVREIASTVFSLLLIVVVIGIPYFPIKPSETINLFCLATIVIFVFHACGDEFLLQIRKRLFDKY